MAVEGEARSALVTVLSPLNPDQIDEQLPYWRVLLAFIAYANEDGVVSGFAQKELAALTQMSQTDFSACVRVLVWHKWIRVENDGRNVYILLVERTHALRKRALDWRLLHQPRWEADRRVADEQRLAEKRAEEARRAELESYWQQRREQEAAEKAAAEKDRLTVSESEFALILSLTYWSNNRGWVDGPRFSEIASYAGLGWDEANAALQGLQNRQLVKKLASQAAAERNRYQLLFAVSPDLQRQANEQFVRIGRQLEQYRAAREMFASLDEAARKDFVMLRLEMLGAGADIAFRKQEYGHFGVVSEKQMFHFLFELRNEGRLSIRPQDPTDPDIVRLQLIGAPFEPDSGF